MSEFGGVNTRIHIPPGKRRILSNSSASPVPDPLPIPVHRPARSRSSAQRSVCNDYKERKRKRLSSPFPCAHGGSYPPRQNGWQRQILQSPLAAPRNGPCFWTASIKYWLQEGSNRQCPPSQACNVRRYSFTPPMRTQPNPRESGFPEERGSGVPRGSIKMVLHLIHRHG